MLCAIHCPLPKSEVGNNSSLDYSHVDDNCVYEWTMPKSHWCLCWLHPILTALSLRSQVHILLGPWWNSTIRFLSTSEEILGCDRTSSKEAGPKYGACSAGNFFFKKPQCHSWAVPGLGKKVATYQLFQLCHMYCSAVRWAVHVVNAAVNGLIQCQCSPKQPLAVQCQCNPFFSVPSHWRSLHNSHTTKGCSTCPVDWLKKWAEEWQEPWFITRKCLSRALWRRHFDQEHSALSYGILGVQQNASSSATFSEILCPLSFVSQKQLSWKHISF